MQIDPKILAAIVIAIVVLIVIAVIVGIQRRKAALRQRFGTEYDRVARERGSEREAQAVLQQREKRVEKFNIRDLSAAEKQQYAERWRLVQARFVE